MLYVRMRKCLPVNSMLIETMYVSSVPVFQNPRGSHVDAVRRHLATIQRSIVVDGSGRLPFSLVSLVPFDATIPTIPMTGFCSPSVPPATCYRVLDNDLGKSTSRVRGVLAYPSQQQSLCPFILIDPDRRDAGIYAG
jgi:hypothetical protein